MENREAIEKYIEVLKNLDPELYEIKLALMATRVNPKIFPKIIRAIGLLALGTSYGQIEIYMNAGEITKIYSRETTSVKEMAILLKDK